MEEIERASDDEESQQTVRAVVTMQEFSELVEPLARKWLPGWGKRLIHGVPPHLRERQPNKHVYDPEIISLGPYHHGKASLREAEVFKYLCLDWFAEGDENKKLHLYNKVLEKIDDIRSCYADVTIVEVEKYDDKRLGMMMLLDGCFIINLMNNCTGIENNNHSDWLACCGMAASIQIMISDVFVLENQIPFQVIQLLLQERKQETVESLVQRFIGWTMKMQVQYQFNIVRENEEPPIHILEACRRAFVETPKSRHKRKPEPKPKQHTGVIRENEELPPIHISEQLSEHTNLRENEPKQPTGIRVHKWLRCGLSRKISEVEVSHTSFRSVMDLKAKGIHFKPRRSHSVVDVTFKSHALFGQLKLPIQYVSPQTRVTLSNLIAYEVSPNSGATPAVLAYVIFMKSLVETPADVKELQRKGILINSFPTHEKAVEVFSEIDTFGYGDIDTFAQVKSYVEAHCRNRAKTWLADLIHTRFETPWSAIALFAALLLLILTFLQTWYTMHPVK
ncbi:hypothetical protein ABFX02_11G012300 [Erythranthe guttata]